MADGQVIVYKYGTPLGVDFDDDALEQMRMAHQLRNALVEVEHGHQDRVQDLWSRHPQIDEANREVERAEAAVEEAREAVADAKKQGRSQQVPKPLRQRLTTARKALKVSRSARRGAKAELLPAIQEEMKELGAERRRRRKAFYREFCQQRGLYWATHNDVLKHHETAVKRMADQRKVGRPANLRFKRWDGTGAIAVQLQREKTKPARAPELLASGAGPYRNVFQLRPWIEPEAWAKLTGSERKKARQGEAILAIGRDRRITVPVLVHRPLPADADVLQVRLVRRRIAGHTKVTLHVTARIPEPDKAASSRTISAHLGWRTLDNGDIRVATLAADDPLPPVPDHLTDILHTSGHYGEIRFPGSWREVVANVAAVRSARDDALNTMRARLAGWLDEHPDADPDGPSAADIRRWKSPNRFASLALRWRETPPTGGQEIANELENWRVPDRRRWEREANERHQLTGRRADAAKRAAAWLTDHASHVVVDDTNVADLARTPAIEAGDDPQSERARSQRQLVAPGELRATLINAAQRRGVTITEVAAAGTSRTHYDCGTEITDRAQAAEHIHVYCPTCETPFDQDANAAAHLLAAA